jgi:hypothetical protein
MILTAKCKVSNNKKWNKNNYLINLQKLKLKLNYLFKLLKTKSKNKLKEKSLKDHLKLIKKKEFLEILFYLKLFRIILREWELFLLRLIAIINYNKYIVLFTLTTKESQESLLTYLPRLQCLSSWILLHHLVVVMRLIKIYLSNNNNNSLADKSH